MNIWEKPLTEIDCLVVDTETTGFPRKQGELVNQPYMIQLAWACIRKGVCVSLDSRLVKLPQFLRVPKNIEELTGITTEHLQEHGFARTSVMAQFHTELLQFPTVVAHNWGFDKQILQVELARQQWDPKYLETKETVCTMLEATEFVKAKKANGALKWPTLSETYKHFTGKPLDGAHNALVDVQACWLIFQKLHALRGKS